MCHLYRGMPREDLGGCTDIQDAILRQGLTLALHKTQAIWEIRKAFEQRAGVFLALGSGITGAAVAVVLKPEWSTLIVGPWRSLSAVGIVLMLLSLILVGLSTRRPDWMDGPGWDVLQHGTIQGATEASYLRDCIADMKEAYDTNGLTIRRSGEQFATGFWCLIAGIVAYLCPIIWLLVK